MVAAIHGAGIFAERTLKAIDDLWPARQKVSQPEKSFMFSRFCPALLVILHPCRGDAKCSIRRAGVRTPRPATIPLSLCATVGFQFADVVLRNAAERVSASIVPITIAHTTA
jgi:hypothetical protein